MNSKLGKAWRLGSDGRMYLVPDGPTRRAVRKLFCKPQIQIQTRIVYLRIRGGAGTIKSVIANWDL